MRRPRTLAARLFLWQFVLVLAILLVLGFFLDRALERRTVDDLRDSLAARALVLRAVLADDTGSLQQEVEAAGAESGTRITVVAADGTPLADSWADPAHMENHATRPEIAVALDGHVGTDQRLSATTGERFLYVAVPVADGRVVRTAVTLAEVADRQRSVRLALLLGFLIAAAAAAVAAMSVARTLVRPLHNLDAAVERMGQGDLTARAEEQGPQEIAALATTLNAMADRIQLDSAESSDARAMRDLILSSMREGIVLYDSEGAVVFANPSVAEHLGTPPSPAAALGPSALREVVTAAMDGHPGQVTTDLGVPPRWLEAMAVPVEGGGVLMVLRDVTQERRLDAVRRDFVANASHELKTPAATIQATAETLAVAAHDDPEAVPRFAQRLEQEAVRLSRIVSDLLDLSRLESGEGLEAVVDLGALVAEEVERARPDAEDGGVALTNVIEQATVRGSRDDLGLLVRNLTSNAIGYTPEGGAVTVRLERDKDEAVLSVRDTGFGIPSRDLDRIFERFYRVDRARSRETGGTGLGLSIVRHVAENHGGAVTVESELGVGSTFTVRLPAYPVEP